MSVYKASREYGVPESTLRDRTRGNVALDSTIGWPKIFSVDEEKQLAGHISYIASIGYDCTRAAIKFMAKDFAVSLGKNLKHQISFSSSWYYDFRKRWPDLKSVKPQQLSIYSPQSASKEKLDNYYKDISTIITQTKLCEKSGRLVSRRTLNMIK